METAKRCITEELGPNVLEIATITPLMETPIYYKKDFGELNSNRKDRQILFMWLVKYLKGERM